MVSYKTPSADGKNGISEHIRINYKKTENLCSLSIKRLLTVKSFMFILTSKTILVPACGLDAKWRKLFARYFFFEIGLFHEMNS